MNKEIKTTMHDTLSNGVQKFTNNVRKCSMLLLLPLFIGCTNKTQTITQEQFEEYAKEHGYIIKGGEETTNQAVLTTLKNRADIATCIEQQIDNNVDMPTYVRLRDLLIAAFPETSSKDINLLTAMLYLHGPHALVDPSIVFRATDTPFFLSTRYGNPMEFTFRMMRVYFDIYAQGWALADELKIPYRELYFEKLSDDVYELVIPAK